MRTLARFPDPASLTKGQVLLTLCVCLSAATQGFSKWGQGLEPGLPSSHGTSLPTPHASMGSPVSSGPVHKSPLESRGRHGSSLILGRSRLTVRTGVWWVEGSGTKGMGDGGGRRLRALLRWLLTMALSRTVLALSFCLVSIGALALAALFWYR